MQLDSTLSKNFEPQALETRWYSHWMAKGYFFSKPDHRPSFTITIPPPNVTGVLHMGHCLNNTIQDVLARRARHLGFNVCWVPGTDHASIATEAKVVQMLRERGIAKSSLSREKFLDYAWEWKEKYGGIILEQLKKMGASLDWQRTAFTMDKHYYDSVISVFNDLHAKGLIYRGKRMINWDPKAKTALSDEEVIRKEVQQQLYHIKYALEDGSGHITIATVRPETIMADAAICVHPKDERYAHLHGKFALIPLINKRIPIIPDDYVTPDFGTGALKVTPAHDMNDYMLGQKHGLEVLEILNEDGTLNENAQILVGEDRFAARKKIAVLLQEAGSLDKTEPYTSEVGHSERSDAVVEPMLSLQWWVKMEPLAAKALEVVMNGDIQFIPARFKNLYRHWMENIKDWCISRQLWWGQRIPAWYDADGRVYVANTEAEAYEKYFAATGKAGDHTGLRQDEDCLDTWFSSWLWPMEVFKGVSMPGNEEINYYYPTNTLVTAPEIIFFWVARMIMAGEEYRQEIPFKQVYYTGIVRDKLGRKMSKSLGNSPDLLGLIDQYGADAVRFGILIGSPAGNDILFDEASLDQGRSFNNKMWNALKLLKLWEARQQADLAPTADEQFALDWMENRLRQAQQQLSEMMDQFRLSEALKMLYSLVWDDYCSYFLEWIKPGFEAPMSAAVYQQAAAFYSRLMHLLNPFMPFVSEEIHAHLAQGNGDLCVLALPEPAQADDSILRQGNALKAAITALREARNKLKLKPKETIGLHLLVAEPHAWKNSAGLLQKQVNAAELFFATEAPTGCTLVAVDQDQFFVAAEQQMEAGAQREELLKELDYQRGFLASVDKKLSNEKFMANAKPEVVANEEKKKADALARIAALEGSLG